MNRYPGTGTFIRVWQSTYSCLRSSKLLMKLNASFWPEVFTALKKTTLAYTVYIFLFRISRPTDLYLLKAFPMNIAFAILLSTCLIHFLVPLPLCTVERDSLNYMIRTTVQCLVRCGLLLSFTASGGGRDNLKRQNWTGQDTTQQGTTRCDTT